MTAWYADSGAVLRTHARVERVEPGAVVLDDGTRVPAGAVVVGIGARPATGWLTGSGVALGAQGEVLADDMLRTSVPDVYAVGDCASFPSARYGERLLVHHWDNALQGPRTVAANIVGADGAAPPAVYDPVPYFWSEQFGRFVQYAGHHAAADRLVWRGDPGEPAWTVCWLRDARLVALLAVGRPRDMAQGRRLIEAGTPVDADLLTDPAVPLKKRRSPDTAAALVRICRDGRTGPGAAGPPATPAPSPGAGPLATAAWAPALTRSWGVFSQVDRPGFRLSVADGSLGSVTEIDAKIDALVPAWLTLPDIAEKLGVEVTRVRQLVKEGQLIAVRRGENRALHVPAAFIDGDKVVKGLSGTLTLLRDDGFTVEEMIEWLFTPDPSLPGTPAQALSENRGTEVKRRAQALAV
ncbi:hypothetical protein GCM10020256_57590 [Streptomyces thermocoprophilus]